MKINYDAKELKIYAENDFERNLLVSKYLMTKLSYVLVDSPIQGFKIKIGEGKSYFNFEKEMAHINKRYSKFQIGYILRIIIDTYVLLKNALPLHAATLETPEKNIFIFGNTHGGKTSLAYKLKDILPCANLVGDDHIIVSEEGIMGNAISRVRVVQGAQEEKYIENYGKGSVHKPYDIIDVDCTCTHTIISKIYDREYVKKDLSYITKYITDDFINEIEAVYMNEFIGNEIKDFYRKQLMNFIKQAKSIVCVKGDIQEIQRNLA